MRRAKKGGIADAGQRALAVPVFEQRFAEDVLPYALHNEAFSLRRARQSGRALAKNLKRSIGKADAELVGARERAVQARHGRELPAGDAGPVGGRAAWREFRSYP